MEENNNMNFNMRDEKNNKTTILIVIIAILTLLLLGLTYYTFFVIDNNDEEKNNFNIQKNNDIITIINPKYNITNDYMGEIVISLEGEVYWLGVDIKDDNIGKRFGTKGTYKIKGYSYPLEEEFEGYKLNIDNIKSAYIFTVGQSGFDYDLVLISNKHKASILHISANYSSKIIEDVVYEMNVKDNIVSAMQEYSSNSRSYCLIDNSGKSYSQYEF